MKRYQRRRNWKWNGMEFRSVLYMCVWFVNLSDGLEGNNDK